MNKIFLVIPLLVISAVLISVGYGDAPSFEERREGVISELSLAIEDAEAQGKYKCCIAPACTMCYLGDWIWKDGTCDCDGMIAQGEFDKVCPQCKNGIEEGLCKSSVEKACDPESGEIFRPIA